MTNNPTHQEHDLLGAYVLGQLNQDETELVAQHLRSCPSCQQENESLLATSELLKTYINKGGEI